MMRVHCIKEEYLHVLENKVNAWLQSHPGIEIIDIKYATVPYYSSPDYSVMIIYK